MFKIVIAGARFSAAHTRGRRPPSGGVSHLARVTRGRLEELTFKAPFCTTAQGTTVAVLPRDALAQMSADGSDPMLSAAAAGCYDTMATVLADGKVDPRACKALRTAASGGHMDVVRLLLANPRVPLNDAQLMFEAFKAAASNGHVGVTELLFANLRVDPTDRQWNDVLTWAAKEGNVAVVDLLLQDSRVCPVKDANEARRSIWERRGSAYDFSLAMLKATGRGHLAVLQRLFADPRAGFLPPKHLSEWLRLDLNFSDTLLTAAVRYGQAEVVDWLLAHPAIDPSAHKCLALRAAAGAVWEIVGGKLSDWEAEAKSRGEKWTFKDRQAAEPRAQAEAEQVRLAIAEKLLADPRVDPAADDDVALAAAADGPNRTMFFRLLADPRVNIANPRRPAIVFAAGGGDVVLLKHLLSDPRVDPAAVTPNGSTALVNAAASKLSHVDAVKLLLADPRVDPAAQDNLAIRLAAKRSSLQVVELLLADPRVDPAAKANEALAEAVRKNSVEVVGRLLEVPAIAAEANLAKLTTGTVKELVYRLRWDGRPVPAAVEAVAREKGVKIK